MCHENRHRVCRYCTENRHSENNVCVCRYCTENLAHILCNQSNQNVSSLFSFFIYLLFGAFKEQFAASDGHRAHILRTFSAGVGKKSAQRPQRHFVDIFRQMGAKYSGYRQVLMFFFESLFIEPRSQILLEVLQSSEQ